ncbi:MAG TPA: two-component regulator propeller domain-containing protein, partial [Ignavibacteriaceae bacterium]|nr:two-component regulator propeller domain-containing protein [Ignavibacteriaceae bacterium]
MRILSHTIYTVLTGLVFIIRLTAQPAGIEFGKISLEQGLSQSTVTSIVQDARGFMWFGTQDGLNRYDGYNIKVFLHNPDDSNSISDNGIWCLLSDSRGDLWIGTEHGGLNRYVYAENKFYHFTNKLNVPFTISDNYVLCLFEDSKHNIWAGTHNGGLNLFNRSTQTFTHFSFSSNSIRSITEDNNGNLWAATGQGLIKFSLAKLYPGKFDHFSYNALDLNSLSSNNINNIFFDKNGLLWIGTWGTGINTYDTETSKFNRYLNDIGSLTNISHSLINSIRETSTTTEKGIWIGTYDRGLYFNNIKNKTLVKYLDENVLTLYEDKSGILWVGTFGNGVRILDKQKHKFVHHYDNPDKTGDQLGNPVISILSDMDDKLWVATLGNVLTRYDRYRKKLTRYTIGVNSTTAEQTYISTLSESSDGTIWIGTFSGGLYSFDEKSGKFKQYRHNKTNNSPISNDISTLEYDKKSNILWLGYLNGGISSFDLSKKLFKHFYPDDNNPKTIPVGLISAIYTGNKTGLWVGIAEKGVARFIEKNNYFKIYLTKSSKPEFNINNNSSLTNNYIFSIYEDDDGLVWFGTKGGGLNRYDPVADSFTNFTVKDGLPNDVVYGIEPDKNGSLWLSTNKGLSKFNPKTGKFRNYDKNDGLQSNEFSEQAHFVSSRGEIFFGGVNGFNTFFPDEIEDNKYIPPVYLTDFKIFDESRALPDPLLNDAPIELSHSQNFFSFEFV